jgi:microcystin-dependent protein
MQSIIAANEPATIGAPGTNNLAQAVDDTTSKTTVSLYTSAANLVPLDPGSVSSFGGGGAHNNMQPYLTVCYCICSNGGLFPSRQ